MRIFRSSRTTAISNDRVRKYIWYALGEILLIVLGILIAVQINDWQEGRKNSANELEYLVSLQEDLVADTIFLNTCLEQVALNRRSALTLLDVFAYPSTTPVDTAALYEAFRYTGFLMHFEPHSATFDDLKSTGNFKVISSLEFKKKLSSYYTFIEARQNFRQVWQEKVWGQYGDSRDEFVTKVLKAHWSNTYYREEFPIHLPVRFEVSGDEAQDFVQSVYNVIDMSYFRATVYSDIKNKARALLLELDRLLT